MTLTPDLRVEYNGLFDTLKIRENKAGEVDAFSDNLLQGQDQYKQVELITGVPWFVVGLIHGLEGDFSFRTHLHNGDSLKHRTVTVPKGRPETGEPPFDWAFSAVDALHYDKFTTWNDWSIAGICYKLEGYNGWGSRSHKVNTPYLWSYSNHYLRGKYVADHIWGSEAVSKQVGAITALWHLVVVHNVNIEVIAV